MQDVKDAKKCVYEGLFLHLNRFVGHQKESCVVATRPSTTHFEVGR